MRIISKARLVKFWTSRKGDRYVQRDFTAWYKAAKNADWSNDAEMKQTFGSADRVGNCVVFDVGNNRYRLITRVLYGSGIIYILLPMDHAEYDKRSWAEECGCHEPPPKKSPKARTAHPKGKPAPHRREGRK